MKSYDHKKIEKKWQGEWDKKKIYQAKNAGTGKKFYGLIEFPYPSGAGLHVGHVRSNTAMDIISRKRRMQGYNVLYPIGWDAFGLPTENYAIKTGIQPAKVTKQNTDTFRKQLKALGFSFDWSREVNTTDPAYYKWTQWIFLQMYKKGLAYKTKTTINWCPKDKIGLANEEVVNGRCDRCEGPVEKREKEQWMLGITKYAERLDKDLDGVDYLEKIKIQQRNWIGKSEGSEIDFKIKTGGTNKVPTQLLIGTRNNAKFSMVKHCLPSLPGIEILSLNDIDPVDDSMLVEGPDFEENARMKAEFYFKKTGIPTISTDNIFWIEKWPKDNGVLVHMRKEVNPKSPRTTDAECVAFFDKWITKHGESKAHFIFGIAYADADGVRHTSSIQREYILQNKIVKKYPDGYPMEHFLKDAVTGEYKCEQKDSVRYNKLIETFNTEVLGWITKNEKVTVFTTRADTLFGAYALILAPEHPLVGQVKTQIKNWNEVAAYIEGVKKQTDMERTAEDKEKTGMELKGIKAVNPINGEEIPVWIADFILVQYGTGAVFADMHDERDFAFAKKYNLPMRKVLEPFDMSTTGPDAFRTDLPIKVYKQAIFAIIKHWSEDKYLCIKWKNAPWQNFITGGIEAGEGVVDAARREVVEETGYTNIKSIREMNSHVHARFFHPIKGWNQQARFNPVYIELGGSEKNELEETEKNLHDLVWLEKNKVETFLNVPNGKYIWQLFQGSLSECFTGEGILVNSGEYSGQESTEARLKIIKAVGGKVVTKFKLRDWVFSRQRYWGEPIPIVHCLHCGYVPVPEKELPITLPKVKSYMPTDNGESPLANISTWVKTKCPKCKGPAKRETDTMPNWAGSSWYFLRYTDPKNKKEFASKKNLKYFTPVDWYNGGMEHTTLHLLYSRFWHKFLYDMKLVPTSEPYMKRTSHGMILAEGGEKMSKSKGNTIDPKDIVENYGADTLRMYEMFMGPFDQAVNWSTESLIGPRRFLERVWKLQGNLKNFSGPRKGVSQTTQNSSNFPEVQKLLHKTIKKVGEDIEGMRFNTAISAMMVLVNEMDKVEYISEKDFKLFLQILAPFAPHMTEELWRELGEKKTIHLSAWPKFNPKLLVEDSIKIAVQINGKVRGEIEIPADASDEEAFTAATMNENVKKWLEGQQLLKKIYVKGRLVNFVI